ncbi:unnamed protein product, partial [Amoebophrya sp. A120]
ACTANKNCAFDPARKLCHSKYEAARTKCAAAFDLPLTSVPRPAEESDKATAETAGETDPATQNPKTGTDGAAVVQHEDDHAAANQEDESGLARCERAGTSCTFVPDVGNTDGDGKASMQLLLKTAQECDAQRQKINALLLPNAPVANLDELDLQTKTTSSLAGSCIRENMFAHKAYVNPVVGQHVLPFYPNLSGWVPAEEDGEENKAGAGSRAGGGDKTELQQLPSGSGDVENSSNASQQQTGDELHFEEDDIDATPNTSPTDPLGLDTTTLEKSEETKHPEQTSHTTEPQIIHQEINHPKLGTCHTTTARVHADGTEVLRHLRRNFREFDGGYTDLAYNQAWRRRNSMIPVLAKDYHVLEVFKGVLDGLDELHKTKWTKNELAHFFGGKKFVPKNKPMIGMQHRDLRPRNLVWKDSKPKFFAADGSAEAAAPLVGGKSGLQSVKLFGFENSKLLGTRVDFVRDAYANFVAPPKSREEEGKKRSGGMGGGIAGGTKETGEDSSFFTETGRQSSRATRPEKEKDMASKLLPAAVTAFDEEKPAATIVDTAGAADKVAVAAEQGAQTAGGTGAATSSTNRTGEGEEEADGAATDEQNTRIAATDTTKTADEDPAAAAAPPPKVLAPKLLHAVHLEGSDHEAPVGPGVLFPAGPETYHDGVSSAQEDYHMLGHTMMRYACLFTDTDYKFSNSLTFGNAVRLASGLPDPAVERKNPGAAKRLQDYVGSFFVEKGRERVTSPAFGATGGRASASKRTEFLPAAGKNSNAGKNVKSSPNSGSGKMKSPSSSSSSMLSKKAKTESGNKEKNNKKSSSSGTSHAVEHAHGHKNKPQADRKYPHRRPSKFSIPGTSHHRHVGTNRFLTNKTGLRKKRRIGQILGQPFISASKPGIAADEHRARTTKHANPHHAKKKKPASHKSSALEWPTATGRTKNGVQKATKSDFSSTAGSFLEVLSQEPTSSRAASGGSTTSFALGSYAGALGSATSQLPSVTGSIPTLPSGLPTSLPGGIPQMPGMPGVPGMPGMPAMPQLPSGMPQLPTGMQQLPGVPGAGAAPADFTNWLASGLGVNADPGAFFSELKGYMPGKPNVSLSNKFKRKPPAPPGDETHHWDPLFPKQEQPDVVPSNTMQHQRLPEIGGHAD